MSEVEVNPLLLQSV